MREYVYGTLCGYRWLPERKCPVCGRTFQPTDVWAYRLGSRYFCRYSCYSVEFQKMNKPKKETHGRESLTLSQLVSIFRELSRGIEPPRVAAHLNLRRTIVRYYYSRYFVREVLPEPLLLAGHRKEEFFGK